MGEGRVHPVRLPLREPHRRYGHLREESRVRGLRRGLRRGGRREPRGAGASARQGGRRGRRGQQRVLVLQPQTPQTGDSGLTLWLTLLLGAAMAVAVMGKKKKREA